MKKFLISVATALSVLVMGTVSVQAEGLDLQDVSPDTIETTKAEKSNFEVLGETAGAVKEVAKGGFMDEYWKVAAEAEAKVNKIAGPNASMWDKFVVRITHPLEICLAPVKHVVVGAVVPIITKVVGA